MTSSSGNCASCPEGLKARGVQTSCQPRSRETVGSQHADYSVGLIVDVDGAADDVCGRTEAAFARFVAQDDNLPFAGWSSSGANVRPSAGLSQKCRSSAPTRASRGVVSARPRR